MSDGILGEHRKAEAGQQLGNGMVDLGIVMIGTTRQHDAVRAGPLHPGERLLALDAHVALERLVLGPSSFDGGIDLRARRRGNPLSHEIGMRLYQVLVQTFFEQVLAIVRQPRIEELHIGGAQFVDVETQRLGIARHDGAVEVVSGAFILLTLPLAAGEPDEVGMLVEQIHDMAVRQLGGIAHALGRHRLDARLVGFLRRRIAQHHTPAQLGEEGEPERVVLVHAQCARNADAAARRILESKRLVIEQAMRLVFE